MKSILSLVVVLLLTTTSYAQSVCPHCGRIHPSPYVYQAMGTTVTGTHVPATSVSIANVAPSVNYVSTAVSRTPVRNFIGNVQALAQQKANTAAAMMNKGHVGGSLGPATHEGVGFSSSSPQQAIDAACYSGSSISARGPGRPRLATAVARGPDGWYSCLLCR